MRRLSMQTRMTELFGIKHPIMLAGMNWLTTPKLVAAVSNAGGLGILGIRHYNAEEARKAIREIKELTDKPFGINLALSGQERRTLVPVVIEEKVPVFNYSLGRPPEVIPVIQAVHEYGGKVIGTVTMKRHALRSEQLGSDMLDITGYEAAAHAGNIGALVIVPIISSAVKIPCIGAGGYTDGRSLAAALALGAEGIAMGSRLAVTQEAEVADTIKQTWLKATEEDTVIDTAFDGILDRVLKNKAAEDMLKKRMPIIDAISAAFYMKKQMKLSFPELVRQAFSLKGEETRFGTKNTWAETMRFAVGSSLATKATVEGDPVNGLLATGQGVGRIEDIPTVAELFEQIVAEAESIIETMQSKRGS
ncbi:NAD(P)H-dependent flavin oxidoreductase [Chloroflexota bacterium]